MYPPFNSEDNYLQIYTDEFYGGQNQRNLRETFYTVDTATVNGGFIPPDILWTRPGGLAKPVAGAKGKTTVADVYSDAGDLTMSPETREPRFFGEIMRVVNNVEGRRISVRVQINTGWGGAYVLIDGKFPSQIPGVKNPCNYITCDSDAYAWYEGTKIIDIVIAENISDGVHKVELFALNAKESGQFFAFNGIKGRFFQVKSREISVGRVIQTAPGNNGTFTLSNESAYPIENIQFWVPPTRVFDDGGRRFFDNTLNIGRLEAGARKSIGYTIDGRGDIDDIDCTIRLRAEYQDATGDIVRSMESYYGVSDTAINYVNYAANWAKDNETPDKRERVYNTANGATLTFKCNAAQAIITIQKEYSYGAADVYVDNVWVMTLNSDDVDGGGFLRSFVLNTGNANPRYFATVKIVAQSGAAPFSLTNIHFTADTAFSTVEEVIPIVAKATAVKPFTPKNVALANGSVIFDAPVVNHSDWGLPRTNIGLEEVRTYGRFPTYCVYYGSGKADILSHYDMLVIEPTAVSYKQVKAWRDQGIKVYGYVSFGEELGDRLDPFDLTSPAAPQIDDGLGPGGYASYYCKAGNGYGEASECLHDCQRVQETKACALGNPNYLTALGRCGPACSWDTREGYVDQSAGRPCQKGWTSVNHYQRSAMQACQTSACPDYAPLNNGCSEFQPGEVIWGQDFSVANPTYPDQNGIWASSFINPLAPRWIEKLREFYLPTLFGLPEPMTETLTMQQYNTASGVVFGVRVSRFPFDDEEPFSITTPTGTYTYVKNLDFSYDATTGVITFPDLGPTPVLNPGQPLNGSGVDVVVSYSYKGLDCDGVFMDTVDTVDVYPTEEYQQAFADMINTLKAENPTRMFCSNRGFSILDKIIKSCSHVMFESFLADYDWATDEYSLIDDPGAIAWNNDIKDLLRNLRRDNVFDVLALNYCHNGPRGDALRKAIYEACYREGYMCWTSTILLNAPEPLRSVRCNRGGKLQTTDWQPVKFDRVAK